MFYVKNMIKNIKYFFSRIKNKFVVFFTAIKNKTSRGDKKQFWIYNYNNIDELINDINNHNREQQEATNVAKNINIVDDIKEITIETITADLFQYLKVDEIKKEMEAIKTTIDPQDKLLQRQCMYKKLLNLKVNLTIAVKDLQKEAEDKIDVLIGDLA